MLTKEQLRVYLPTIKNNTNDTMAGIAWAALGSRHPADERILNPSWYHTWTLRDPNNLPDLDAEFVQHFACDQSPAMAWGDDVDADYVALADNFLGHDFSDYLLVLNEPDQPGQCYMSPARAAKFYRFVRRTYPLATIIWPQPSDQDYKKSWVWLRAFYDEVERFDAPFPDVAAIHSYLAEEPQLIIDSMFELLGQYNASPTTAWVTEFGQDAGVVRQMIRTYKRDFRVKRYAYFTPRHKEGGFEKYTLFASEDGEALSDSGRVWVEEHS